MLCRYIALIKIIFVSRKINNMRTLLATKQNEEQKRSNDYARYQFIMAMMNIDDRMIGVLLKKNRRYLGNLNSWQVLHWFNNKFSKLDSNMFHSKYTEGISLDVYPGAEMFEFSFAPMESNYNYDPLLSNENHNENAIFSSKKAFHIKLVLLFEDGQIADIRIPKIFISKEKIKNLQCKN